MTPSHLPFSSFLFLYLVTPTHSGWAPTKPPVWYKNYPPWWIANVKEYKHAQPITLLPIQPIRPLPLAPTTITLNGGGGRDTTLVLPKKMEEQLAKGTKKYLNFPTDLTKMKQENVNQPDVKGDGGQLIYDQIINARYITFLFFF